MSANRKLTVVLLIALLLGILVCLWRITRSNPTQSEVLLLSLVLTILSIIGSWIASAYYAESSFNSNLRVFALKAAEKVTNLSNELDRLSVFLQQELKETEFDSPNEAILSKNARMESAIHIINTLKSVNDRSLSDWQGVIGEEITAQRQEQETREETLRELLERLDSVSIENANANQNEDPNARKLLHEVDSIKTEMRLLAAQVGGVPIRPTKNLRKKQLVEKKCPTCLAPLSYWQKPRENAIKAVECLKCGARLYSRSTDGDFILQFRIPVAEEVTCPGCAQKFSAPIDPLPGTSQRLDCPSCKANLLVSRGTKDVRVKIQGLEKHTEPIGEEFIKRVGELMGPQPWAKGRSRTIATGLNVDHTLVSQAVQELIRRGVFKVQIDGKLYSPEKARAANDSAN